MRGDDSQNMSLLHARESVMSLHAPCDTLLGSVIIAMCVAQALGQLTRHSLHEIGMQGHTVPAPEQNCR